MKQSHRMHLPCGYLREPRPPALMHTLSHNVDGPAVGIRWLEDFLAQSDCVLDHVPQTHQAMSSMTFFVRAVRCETAEKDIIHLKLVRLAWPFGPFGLQRRHCSYPYVMESLKSKQNLINAQNNKMEGNKKGETETAKKVKHLN